jgi:hypothetical protein
MTKETTIKALEHIAKAEYSTAATLDAAITQAEDDNLRTIYRRWRDDHIRQAEAVNRRIKKLGGREAPHNLSESIIYPLFWSLMRGNHDALSVARVRLAARRTINQYVNRLDQIDDTKSLNIVRKNLETKRREMHWYNHESRVQHTHELEAKLEKTRNTSGVPARVVKHEEGESKSPAPLAALLVAGAVGAAAFFIARRNGELHEDSSIEQFKYDYGDGPTQQTEIKA